MFFRKTDEENIKQPVSDQNETARRGIFAPTYLPLEAPRTVSRQFRSGKPRRWSKRDTKGVEGTPGETRIKRGVNEFGFDCMRHRHVEQSSVEQCIWRLDQYAHRTAVMHSRKHSASLQPARFNRETSRAEPSRSLPRPTRLPSFRVASAEVSDFRFPQSDGEYVFRVSSQSFGCLA